MPPKNNFNIGKGRLYTPDGVSPLGGLFTVEDIEWEEPTPWPKENPFLALRDAAQASIEGLLTPSRPLLRLLLVDNPSPKVRRIAHLARYGKKLRTRKKNLNRLYQLI